jgi:serine/threonine protein kinase
MNTVVGYDLGEKLHEGMRSVVYRGRRRSDGLAVIVKGLRGEHPSRDDLAQLKREYEITRSLDVADVIKVHALERDGAGLAVLVEDCGAAAPRSPSTRPCASPSASRPPSARCTAAGSSTRTSTPPTW